MVEKFQEYRDRAKKKIQIADHLLSVTYPLVKDTRLLLAIVEHIFLSYTNGISAVLYHARLFKKIPPFQDNFESKFNLFKEWCVHNHNIDRDYINEILQIKEILVQHKKSPVAFARKDKFVICADNYRMKTISVNEISNYLNKAKIFIQAMDNIVRENEGIFR